MQADVSAAAQRGNSVYENGSFIPHSSTKHILFDTEFGVCCESIVAAVLQLHNSFTAHYSTRLPTQHGLERAQHQRQSASGTIDRATQCYLGF